MPNVDYPATLLATIDAIQHLIKQSAAGDAAPWEGYPEDEDGLGDREFYFKALHAAEEAAVDLLNKATSATGNAAEIIRDLALYCATTVEKHQGEENIFWSDTSIEELRSLLRKIGYDTPAPDVEEPLDAWAEFWENN